MENMAFLSKFWKMKSYCYYCKNVGSVVFCNGIGTGVGGGEYFILETLLIFIQQHRLLYIMSHACLVHMVAAIVSMRQTSLLGL